MEEYREFGFLGGRVRFKQPKRHRLSVVEVLFVANLRGIKRGSRVVDLGAGFGALSILTALIYPCEVWAVERDPLMLELLEYNVKKNNLSERINIVDADIRSVGERLEKHAYDSVIMNPPFYPSSYLAQNPYHHESDTTLKDFIKSVAYLLKDGGKLNAIISTFRLIEMLFYMEGMNIHPSHLRFFYPKKEKNAKIVRVYAVKNLKPALVVEKPLIINQKNGEYTEEVRETFEKFYDIINRF